MDETWRRGNLDLADGRRVSFCEAGGAEHPAVVYCHGTPGSRLELLLARQALEASAPAVRLIAWNRPGYGESSFIPLPGFTPWVRDVHEVLDRLQVGRFSLLGASGGAPFALACAASSRDRVERVAIVAGVAPPDTPGMEESATIAGELRSQTARRIRGGALSLAVRSGLGNWMVTRLIRALGPADRAAMDDPVAIDRFRAVVTEAFSQWGRAGVNEAGLFLRPWDFDPALIRCEVRIWHGGDDNRIPPGVASGLAARIPGAQVVVWPQHGHFSWALSSELDEVVAYLVGGEP